MFALIRAICVALWSRILEIRGTVATWSRGPYIVQTRTNRNVPTWPEQEDTYCDTLASAKQYLANAADTYFWVQCRILDPEGNIVDQTVANDFYCAPAAVVHKFINTDMTCEEAARLIAAELTAGPTGAMHDGCSAR